MSYPSVISPDKIDETGDQLTEITSSLRYAVHELDYADHTNREDGAVPK